MQGYCPLCSKNGITTKIKAFQLSFDEAVFMCSNVKCAWPVGCQELIFINRSIGKDWSNSWEKVATQKLKHYHQVDKTVSDRSTTFTEDNTCTFQEDSRTLSKPCDLSLDINNESKLALQPVDSDSIKCKVGASPMNNNDNSNTSSMINTKSTDLNNVALTVNSNSTSLGNNFVPVKTNNLIDNLSRISKVSKSLSVNSKLFNRARVKAHSFKKLSLDDLQKTKSIDAKKENKLAMNGKLNNKQENSNEINKTLTNHSNQVDCDLDLSLKKLPDNSETVKNGDSEFNLDELLNGFCNEINGKTEVENTDDYDWIDSLFI